MYKIISNSNFNCFKGKKKMARETVTIAKTKFYIALAITLSILGSFTVYNTWTNIKGNIGLQVNKKHVTKTRTYPSLKKFFNFNYP